MQVNSTLKLNHMLKKTIISCAMIGAFALALASSGGGDKKKAEALRKPDFTPIRTTNGFTLKAGPMYRGSQLLNMQKQKDVVLLKSVVTYQKGNTTFILPYQYKMAKPAMKSNLNAVDVKINLHK